jgi:hypothetical protein
MQGSAHGPKLGKDSASFGRFEVHPANSRASKVTVQACSVACCKIELRHLYSKGSADISLGFTAQPQIVILHLLLKDLSRLTNQFHLIISNAWSWPKKFRKDSWT